MPERISTMAALAQEAASKSAAPSLDKENAFMLYATFCADVERTAHALDMTPDAVRALAAEGEWDAKLRGILELKKSGKPGDVERAINRALNFVQAHRFRLFLERVLKMICEMPTKEIDELLISVETNNRSGVTTKKFSTRPLADLSAALEKAHCLTYLALNDSTTERRGREDSDDGSVTGGELHAQIARAVAGSSPGHLLSSAQEGACK